MSKIVVPTKFNKTGKRVLQVPVTEDRLFAPAYQIYRRACEAAEQEREASRAEARDEYVESMAEWVASYVAEDSTPASEKHRITKLLAMQDLQRRGPMNIEGPGSSARWSVQIGGISGLPEAERQAWVAYLKKARGADAEKDAAVEQARRHCEEMKRELRIEVREGVLRQAREVDSK